jgi:hypothetical protein
MHVICAWCKKELGNTCPICGHTLEPIADNPDALICRFGETPIVFSITQLNQQPISHGICEACADKLNAGRAERIAQRTMTPEDRANLIASATLSPHEARTSEDK